VDSGKRISHRHDCRLRRALRRPALAAAMATTGVIAVLGNSGADHGGVLLILVRRPLWACGGKLTGRTPS
jgi:hypothetical protein